MPTNKLWLEHTERAAWDSVDALRERLLKAEARLRALATGVDCVPELLDALDAAKSKHATDAAGHVEVVQRLVERVEQLESELNQRKTTEPTVVTLAAPRPRLDSDDWDDRARGRDVDDVSDLEAFAHNLQRRSDAELPRDVNRLLSLTENKVDELTELEGAALREAALDLALLAAKIYALSRT